MLSVCLCLQGFPLFPAIKSAPNIMCHIWSSMQCLNSISLLNRKKCTQNNTKVQLKVPVAWVLWYFISHSVCLIWMVSTAWAVCKCSLHLSVSISHTFQHEYGFTRNSWFIFSVLCSFLLPFFLCLPSHLSSFEPLFSSEHWWCVQGLSDNSGLTHSICFRPH